ncbi:hypothetical protein GWI33_007979 [Rhynchophorus ferrugineus]|uniref:Uncharacterized protein n=1 Tax=Rhynchophorus ferrugineus TaxID=354439 RepID=A0A834IDL3_RHYFE|nr:hypothetical protein GWI33_007979 [Rhynchophorus ferrugineus]
MSTEDGAITALLKSIYRVRGVILYLAPFIRRRSVTKTISSDENPPPKPSECGATGKKENNLHGRSLRERRRRRRRRCPLNEANLKQNDAAGADEIFSDALEAATPKDLIVLMPAKRWTVLKI